MKIRSGAKDSSCPEAEKKDDFLHRHWGQVLHRWTAPSDTNPCGNAPFGTALRHSTINHPSSSWHQSYPYIHIHIHQPYIYIYLSWVIVGLAGECVKVALRVL